MANTKAVVGFPSWTDDFTFSGGSYHVKYPVSNLKVLPLSRVARTSDLVGTSTVIKGTCAVPRPVQLFGLCRHSITQQGTYRLRLYSDAAWTTLVYDSGIQPVWIPPYPSWLRHWFTQNFFIGGYAPHEIAGYPWIRPIYLDQSYVIQSHQLDISDPGNPAGFVKMGRFEIAEAWPVSINFSNGSQYGFRPRTNIKEADGGVEYSRPKAKARVFQGTINYLPEDEALAKGFELQRQMDIHKPFLVMPNPSKPVHWLRNVIFARNADLPLLSYQGAGRHTFPFSWKEII